MGLKFELKQERRLNTSVQFALIEFSGFATLRLCDFALKRNGACGGGRDGFGLDDV